MPLMCGGYEINGKLGCFYGENGLERLDVEGYGKRNYERK